MLEAIQSLFAVYFNKQTMRVTIRVGVSKDGNAVGSNVDDRRRAVCLLVLAAVANSSLSAACVRASETSWYSRTVYHSDSHYFDYL